MPGRHERLNRPPVELDTNSTVVAKKTAPRQTALTVSQKSSPRTRHLWWRALLFVFVLVLAAVGVFGYTQYKEAMRTVDYLKADASTLMSCVDTLKTAAPDLDFATCLTTVRDLKATTEHMKGLISSPEFDFAAERFPQYAGDVLTARELLDIVEDACDTIAVPALTTLVENPLSGLLVDGGINVGSVYTLLGMLDPLRPSISHTLARLSALPEFTIPQLKQMADPLMAQIQDLDVEGKLDKVQALIDEVEPLLRALLGEDGNKTYLIVAQNLAEMHSTGGFPGAVGSIILKDGKITLGSFDGVMDAMVASTPAEFNITDVEMEISRNEARWSRCANYQPDFIRAAQIWAKAYEEKTGIRVDGVISLTPPMVQHVLEIAGSITLSDGLVLDGSNATRVLQHDLYWKYVSNGNFQRSHYALMDDLFAEAAKKAFHQLMDNLSSDDLMDIYELIMDGFESREAMLWLVDPDDQAVIEPFDWSGALRNDPAKPSVGVFFNTYIPSKTAWWMDQTTTIGEGTPNDDGTTTYEVTSTFTNACTAEEGRAGGQYIMGTGEAVWDYIRYGVMKPIILLVAPADGLISDISTNIGGRWTPVEFEGHQMWYTKDTIIWTEQTLVVTFKVTVSAEAEEVLTFYSQPTLTQYRLAG